MTTTWLHGGAALQDAAPAEPQPPTICILALSPIADDPRVRRQAEAFHRAGWTVIAVGLPGARSPAPEWRIMTSEDGRAMELAAEAAAQAQVTDATDATPAPEPQPREVIAQEAIPQMREAAVAARVAWPAAIPVRSLVRGWSKQRLRALNQRVLHVSEPRWRQVEHRLVQVEMGIGGTLAAAKRSVHLTRARILNGSRRIYRELGVAHMRRLGVYAVGAAHSRLLNGVRILLSRYYRLRRMLGPTERIGYALRLQAVHIRPKIAQDIYWSFSAEIRNMYACARQAGAAVWLANDWTMLPTAARLAREMGGFYGYDTHEFAAEEYGDKLKWRFWRRPMICALERAFIGDAAVVSAVSAGIAERLGVLYRLPRPTMVIRNTPAYEQFPFRPTGERVRVLYHGIVTPGRGLEATIDSVAAWRPEFDLTIRGPGDAAYLDELRRRIEKSGLNSRVWLVPPVPMIALVREAAAFDIGFFALPGSSLQFEFALPNKLFEYVMAGLAVCVTDLPEMGRLVRQYNLGMTIRKVEPGEIAAVINRAQRPQIDTYKRNALAAARELCWDRESERLVGAYSALLHRAAAVAG